MYEVSIIIIHDVLDIYELRETHTQSYFRICPGRGGMVISYAPGGQECLYLDETTFRDPAANVRGGIPVLWPISGQLPNGQYDWDDKGYTMPNHGLVRQLSWSVVDVDTADRAAITLKVSSNEDTLLHFPFAFELSFTYELRQGRLSIFQTYQNLSDVPMPMYAGFHPYFLAVEKKLSLQSDATHYLDLNDGTQNAFREVLDLSDKVESLVLLDAVQPRLSFCNQDPAQRPIFMTYGPEFKYCVLWTVSGKDFVCVEPWMALSGSLQSKQGLQMVPPQQSLSTFVTFSTE